MNFKIPLTLASNDKLKKRSAYLKKIISYKKNTNLQKYLINADAGLTREDYLAICYSNLITNFSILLVTVSVLLYFFNVNFYYLLGPLVAVFGSCFALFSQMNYPKIYSERKQHRIERNLIPALEDIVVQLNAGIPLYTILVNISASDYGELTEEFKKAVKKMNGGLPQVEVLEEMGEKNSSLHFRRTLWQISNGMRAGSDISVIIKESIHSLNEEQLVQIQNYGNKLNPLIMFYMLSSVIIPALSITFLTVISSIINIDKTVTMAMFIGMFMGVMLIQTMFLGAIKSIRPTLL